VNVAVRRSSTKPARDAWRLALPVLVAVLAALSAPRHALASELIWEGPAECAASDQLRFAVERALGVPLERASHLIFEARVEISNSVASARLRVTPPGEAAATKERVFVAPDCSKLVDTLAVAVTLAIASFTTAASVLDAGATESSNGILPLPAEPAPREPTELDTGDGDGAVDLSALFSLVGDSGSLPSPAVGASLGVELGSEPYAVRALGTLLFEQRVRLASPDGDAAADLGLIFGTLQACVNALSATSSLAIPVCAGVDAGVLSGSGVSIARPRRASALWLAPRADIGLLWDIPFTRLRVGLLLTAAAPLERDEFVVRGIGAVHRVSAVVGRASLGIALRF
jgi:hypothetical protein